MGDPPERQSVRGVTRYYELANMLRSQIFRGEHPVGAQLPTEAALAAHHGLSLETVRRALAELVAEGLVVKRHGRGTFVERSASLSHGLNVTVPLESLLENGRTFPARVIVIRHVSPPAWVAESLDLAGRAEVVEVERVRMRTDAPLVYSRCYLPLELAVGLEAFLGEPWRPDQQLQLFVESAAAVRIDEARQQTEATAADHDTARHLNVVLGAPVLRGYRWYYAGGRILYCGLYTWPGDRFRLQVTLNREDLAASRNHGRRARRRGHER